MALRCPQTNLRSEIYATEEWRLIGNEKLMTKVANVR
jgi:hypothetical protein